MQRNTFLALASTSLAALAAVGCGSSNSTKTEGTGRLADAEIAPLPGATFIARDSEFTIFWSSGFEPPASFTARLYQIDGAGGIAEVPSTLVRDGQEFRWFLRPTSNLPFRSALYVELTAPSQTSLNFAYISGSRSLATPKAPTHAGGAVANLHRITVR